MGLAPVQHLPGVLSHPFGGRHVICRVPDFVSPQRLSERRAMVIRLKRVICGGLYPRRLI